VDRESSLDQHLADPNLEFHRAVTTALILAHRPSPIIDGAQLFDFFFFLESLNYLISFVQCLHPARHEPQAPHEVEGRQHRQRGWPSIIVDATWLLRLK
jgi:hypothetical protein